MKKALKGEVWVSWPYLVRAVFTILLWGNSLYAESRAHCLLSRMLKAQLPLQGS